MVTIQQISDYVIFKSKFEGNSDLSNLKLQKLLYYIQAWHLAFNEGQPLFKENFEAWIHGPVNREIYNLYKDTKYLYSEMGLEDMQEPNIDAILSNDIKNHVNNILDSYAKFTATELEIMTHQETPWLEARSGVPTNERCNNEIKNDTMHRYYAARLQI